MPQRQSMRMSTDEVRLLDAVCLEMGCKSRSHGLVRCLIHTAQSIGGLRPLVDAALAHQARVRRRQSAPITRHQVGEVLAGEGE